jgi:hypothetical protein
MSREQTGYVPLGNGPAFLDEAQNEGDPVAQVCMGIPGHAANSRPRKIVANLPSASTSR